MQLRLVLGNVPGLGVHRRHLRGEFGATPNVRLTEQGCLGSQLCVLLSEESGVLSDNLGELLLEGADALRYVDGGERHREEDTR